MDERLRMALEERRSRRVNRVKIEKTKDAESHAEEIRDRCKTLSGFIAEAWPILEPETPFIHNWHIDAIAEHIEAVHFGQLGNVAFNCPPGFSKSLIISVFAPAWIWTLAPGRRFVSGSYEEQLALRDNERMRALVQSGWYSTLWGERTRLIKSGTRSFINVSRGGREAAAFTSLTGKRGDVVLIDDPHSTKTAESDAQREEAVRLFRESIQSRVNNPERSAIIVIMQRLHQKDICGTIDDLGLDYERVILPMEFDPARRRTTSIGWTDPRKERGELLDKQRFPAPVVEKLKKSVGSFAWSCQYQQEPTPREGGMFSRSYFDGKLLDVQPHLLATWRHWDLADTDLSPNATTGARTAGVKMGVTATGEYVICDCKAAGVGGARRRKLIVETAKADGALVSISLPQDPGAAGKTTVRDLIGMLAGYNARRLVEGALGNKVQRAEPFAAQCEAGNVYLMRGAWNEEFLTELCQFPSGARKDIADACSGAFAQLVARRPQPAGVYAPIVIHG